MEVEASEIGDVGSYFLRNDEIKKFEDSIETYMNISYITSFPHLITGTVTFGFDGSSHDPCSYVATVMRAFVCSYIYGLDMEGNNKDTETWINKLKKATWKLVFGTTFTVKLSEGCLSIVNTTIPEKSCSIMISIMDVIPDVGIVTLVVVPRIVEDSFIDVLNDRTVIKGIFIDPNQENKESLSEICKNPRLVRIGLVKGRDITEEIIEICSSIVMEDKPKSSKLIYIDIPVRIRGEEQVQQIRKKFPSLERIATYSATNKEADEVRPFFNKAYGKNIEVERRT